MLKLKERNYSTKTMNVTKTLNRMWEICVVLLISTTQVKSSKDLCDIRTWYLKLITDGIFNVELTPEMFQLKQNIETLVLNSADGLIDCQNLVIYNVMLKDKLYYKDDKTLSDDIKEVTVLEGVRSQEDNDKTFSFGSNKNDLLDTKKETNEEKLGIVEDNKDTNSKEIDTEGGKDLIDHQGIDQFIKEKDVNIEEIREDKEDAADLTETQNNEQQSEVEVSDDQTDDLTDIDETDLIVNESDLTDSEDQVDSGDPNVEENFATDNEPDNEAELEFVTRTIPVGICISFGCLQSDVFDVFGLDDMANRNENVNEENEDTIDILEDNVKEENGQQSSENVSSGYTESKTVPENKDQNIQNVNEKTNANFGEIRQNEVNKREKVPLDHCFARRSTCSNICMYASLRTFCFIGYDSYIVTTESSSLENKHPNNDNKHNLVVREVKNEDKNEESLISKNQEKITGKENTEQIELSADSNNLEEVALEAKNIDALELPELSNTDRKSSDHIDNELGFYSDTGQIENFASKSIEVENHFMFKDISGVNKKLDEIENKNKQEIKLSKVSVDEFEKIIHQTTNQYAQKIQTLELMIMKLENQLLVEKMNKQNHSSTITRLENLILKLENDFLKLNTQYDEIKTENDNMSKRQNHYLELAYKNQKQTCKQLQLPDKSAKTSELLSQHQLKIMELTDILKNQSSIIKAIKNRYDSLEEQNRMLHQMIMNQTIFMTSIIHTLQDLSKQNYKNKEEIKELREKLANGAGQNSAQKPITKDNILDAIDKYAHDEKIDISGSGYGDEDSDDDADENESDRNLKLYLRRKSTEESITQWCPLNNDTCPSCFYRNVLQVNCIPFKPLFWSSCGASCKLDQNSKTKQTRTESAKENTSLNKEKENRTKYTNEDIHSQDGKLKSPTAENRETEHDVNNNPGTLNAKDELTREKNKSAFESIEKIGTETEYHSVRNRGDAKDVSTETKLIGEIKEYGEEIDEKSKNHNKDKQVNTDTINEKKDENALLGNTKENDIKISDSRNEQLDANGDKREGISQKEQNMNKESDSNDLKPSNNGGLKENKEKDKSKQSSEKEKKQTSDAKKDNKDTKKQTQEQIGKSKKLPVNMVKEKQDTPKDCYDYYKRGNKNDGIYKINPIGLGRMIEVFCDMRKGGWTVIQRRQDGTMKFFREWKDYKTGFGGLYGEHWLGNDNLHFLTNQDYYKLRVDLMDWDKNKKYAEYDYFLVESEEDGYRINIDGYTGDAGDGLSKHHGHKFSTKDVDNDKVVKEFGGSCAVRFHGAGWYYKCYASNLNGKFYKGGKIPEKKYDGVTWKPWTGPNYSLKKVEMKIKPANNK